LRDTERAVTPYGGLSVFVEYLRKIEYAETIRQFIPIQFTSPNAIDPAETFTAFLISVLSGARRFAHASLLRFDKALHCLVGIMRFPTDDTMRNLFKRFGQAKVSEFYASLTQWQIQRLPERSEGYSLDLDSTVFERYGHQQGALKGYNPKKHGRPSHHPLLAVLSEAHFVLHAWLRSGNCSSSRGVVEFLKEALALLAKGHKIRVVRADSGFFDDKLLSFLEGLELPYIVVARMTRWIKNEAIRIREWIDLDSTYSVAEFKMQLYGWNRERRIVVVRELVKDKPSMGKRLFNIPEYTFRLFVTSLPFAPEEIWRDYNQRSDMENRIAELKYDLAADDFCLKEFFATAATMPWFKNTIFVITADHTSEAWQPFYKNRVGQYSIPILFYQPEGGPSGHQGVVAQQTDIMPTLLDMLHYPKSFVAFGGSLLRNNESRFSLSYLNGNYQLIRNGYAWQTDYNISNSLYHFENDSLLTKNLYPDQSSIATESDKLLKAVIQQYNNRIIENKLLIQ